VEVKREAKIVRDILATRKRGATLASIADTLNAKGIAGKRGGKWYPSTVAYIVKSRAA